jgi:3-phenylpropionate/trans-cinnamate dioxygenase ferredoxin subunit
MTGRKAAASRAAKRYAVARVEELAEGERLLVDVGGRPVGIFRRRGRFFALLNRCPHQGGPLCSGGVVALLEADRPGDIRINPARELVTCPWHGWEFDIETGQSYVDPARLRARRYEVAVESGSAIRAAEGTGGEVVAVGTRVPGPYVAESFPVDVEGEYIVVTMPR